MKICFYGNGIAFTSGSASLVRCLGKNLVKQGHEVVVATRAREDGIKIIDGIQYVPIFVEKKETIASYYLQYPFYSLKYFLRNDNIDVIHTMASYHSFALVARLVGIVARKPTIYSILSPASACLSLLGFDKLICTSKNIKRIVNTGVYIPPYLDLNDFGDKSDHYDFGREDAFVVGTMGTPLHRRGIDVLVKAIPLVLQQYPDTVFVLAINLNQTQFEPRLRKGFDSILKLIEDLCIPAKNIRIVGEVDVPTFFRSLDIFVYAVQTTKGMIDIPPTILECLAAQCVLISTSVGEIPEVVQNYGNGILIDKEYCADPQVYARNIIELIGDKNLRKNLKMNARKSVEIFDTSKIVPQIIALYREVCGR